MDCFFFLAIRNNAASKAVQAFLWTHVLNSLGCICGSGVAEPGDNAMFTFWGPVLKQRLFPKVTAPFHIPTSHVEGFLVLHILTVLLIVHLYYSHPRLYVVFHCSSDRHFTNTLRVSSYDCWSFVYFLWRDVYLKNIFLLSCKSSLATFSNSLLIAYYHSGLLLQYNPQHIDFLFCFFT